MGTVVLRERLDAFRAGLMERITPEKRKLLAESDAALVAADRGATVPQPGEDAPDFTLADHGGEAVSLRARLHRGPAVLLFFRGGWCPFCTLTLRTWQEALPSLRRAGGQLLAVSPQPLGGCASTADRDMLDFHVLSDPGNRVSRLYRVDYELPEVLRPFYLKLGHDLPAINGSKDWTVPLPASFVIGQDGKVVRSHVGPLLHQRLEPSEAINAIRELAAVHA